MTNLAHLIDSRDCVSAGCPNEADGMDGLCRTCRAWADDAPPPLRRLQLVHSRRETPVCKIEGCDRPPGDRRGIYAGLCLEHKERKRAERAAVDLTRDEAPEPTNEYELTDVETAGPLLREVLDAQPAYELAQEAAAVVKARMEAYGPPHVNHGCTAELWSTWLNRRFGVRLELTAADVCWLNVLQKLSREANLAAGDNRLDVMGFAINAELTIRADNEEAA